jgi:hypothetical protein
MSIYRYRDGFADIYQIEIKLLPFWFNSHFNELFETGEVRYPFRLKLFYQLMSIGFIKIDKTIEIAVVNSFCSLFDSDI